ncbi:unnamed protein product, partial [Iphiclides podalirius]
MDPSLPIQPSLTKDLNKEQYLFDCVAKIKNTIETILGKKEKFLSFKTNEYKAEINAENIFFEKRLKHISKESIETNLKKGWRLKFKNQGPDANLNKTEANDVYEFHD